MHTIIIILVKENYFITVYTASLYINILFQTDNLSRRGEGGAGADISAQLVSEKEKPAASPRGACKVTGAQMSQTCAVCGIPARQRCVFTCTFQLFIRILSIS